MISDVIKNPHGKDNKNDNSQFKRFCGKYNSKNDFKNECDLRKVYYSPVYPRDFIITTIEGFVSIGNGQMGGTHLTCFYMKDNKPYYFGSF